ncbi:uncharacterized protein LOC143856940 [Tasmannia lanceolata]|uniref:uncharacterized protein LOC143856940 n=1 Tax=Tasmannia lanceolata TaxID=3420 RepID=UPI0040645AC0
MSSSFRGADDFSVDVEELLQIGTMCRENYESDVMALSEAHSKDNKYTEELEKELRNCSQEIGYLQDQLNLRNVEANCVAEHVHSLELKLAEVHKLHEKVNCLRKEMVQFDSERLFFMRKLKQKEVELQHSAMHIEKLETVVSSIALESQCEIESLRLDLMAMEQSYFDAKKINEQDGHEKAKMGSWIEELEARFQESQQMISCLEKENKELQEKIATSEKNAKQFCHKIEEHLDKWLKKNNISGFNKPCLPELPISEQMSAWEEVLGPFLSKLAVVATWDENLRDEMEKMSHQIHESDLLVKQLKEELRKEKSKAKEEAEDLTQEMAELRYHITDMLEQECKRRACIEQASLQRISELEAQLRKEQRKSSIAIRFFREAQKLAEGRRSINAHNFKTAVVGSHPSEYPPTISRRIDTCSCGERVMSGNLLDSFDEELLKAEAEEENYAGRVQDRAAAIGRYSEETDITLEKL